MSAASCKRCGASLPPAEAEGDAHVTCPACGAVRGVSKLAESVLAALADQREPAAVLPPGVHVEWQPSLRRGEGFRGAAAQRGGQLTVRASEVQRTGEAYLSLAAGLLLTVALWLPYRGGFQLWLTIVAALIGLTAYLVLGRLSLTYSLVVSDAGLVYTSRAHARLRSTSKTVPRSDILQLYVVELPETQRSVASFELRLRRADGTSVTLDDWVNPELPLLLEALAEYALGVEDVPVEGEVDRHVARKRTPVRLGVAVALGAALSAVSVAVLEVFGDPLEPMLLSDQPQQRELSPWRPVRVHFSSWLYFDRAQPSLSGPFGSASGLDKATAFHIELERDGQVVRSLSCDPYELVGLAFVGSGEEHPSYVGGFMRGCALDLPAGRSVLRARAVPLGEHEGPVKQRLEPRVRRRLW